MNFKYYFLTLLSLIPFAVSAVPATQELPGNQYALVLEDRIYKCDIWLNAVNTAFKKETLDEKFFQRWTSWQQRATKIVDSPPTSSKEREAWVTTIHGLFKEHEQLSKTPAKMTNTFPISIRGLVKKPQTIQIKKGTSIKQAVEKVGGLYRIASCDLFALYRNGTGVIYISKNSLLKPIQLRPGDMIVYLEKLLLDEVLPDNGDPFNEENQEHNVPARPIVITSYFDVQKNPLFQLLTILPPSQRSDPKSAKAIKAALSTLEKAPQYYPEYEKLGYGFAIQATKLYKKLYGKNQNDYKLRSFITTYLTKVAENPTTSELQLRHILNFLTLNRSPSQQSVLKIFKKRFPDHWAIPVYQVIHEQS